MRHWFFFYLELVYNLLLIKTRAERDLEPGLLRADVERIEMSVWQEFGFERNAEIMPVAFLGGGHAEQIAHAGKKVGRGRLQRAGMGMPAPSELVTANPPGRWQMDALPW